MQLVGQYVKHSSFGEGIVRSISDRFITIQFMQGDKKFLYPDAFLNFLKLKDEEKQKEMNTRNMIKSEQDRVEKERERKNQQKRLKLRTMKILSNSQAVFDVDFKDAENIVEQGLVSTGSYLSGTSKGKPRIPNKLRPNSVCLITGVDEGCEEKERRILGAFAVNEQFLGEDCQDGIIQGHDKYKVILMDDMVLPFWDYFDQGAAFLRWGRVPFKYCSNRIMKKILFDIVNLLDGTKQEKIVNEFYQYFCNVNQLPTV